MHTQTMAVFGAVSGVLGGGAVGYLFGRRLRAVQARRRFWAASGVSLALGLMVVFLGRTLDVDFVTGFGIGVMTGGLNGLRWGMGRLADTPRRAPERVAPAEGARSGELVPEDRAEQAPPPWGPGRPAPPEGSERRTTPVG